MTPKVLKAKIKPYYKLKDDAPTAADKAREAAMAEDLMKEDFYGKKRVPEKLEKIGKDAINKKQVDIMTERIRKYPKGIIVEKATVIKKKP